MRRILDGQLQTPLVILAGAALLLAGVGAVVMSTAFQQPTVARVLGPEAPIDAGARIGFGAKHGLADLGGRLALVSDDRRALAVWTDTRAGTQASNKQDLARAVVGFSDPARLSETAKGVCATAGWR